MSPTRERPQLTISDSKETWERASTPPKAQKRRERVGTRPESGELVLPWSQDQAKKWLLELISVTTDETLTNVGADPSF